MAKPKPKPDDAEQSKRFEETARALDVDESGKLFDRAIDNVVTPTAPRSHPAARQPSS